MLIDPVIINPFNRIPGQRSAFCGSQILHRMKRKTGKIRNGTAFSPISLYPSLCAKRMRAVCHYRHSSNGFLNLILRMKQSSFPLHDIKDPGIIAQHSSHIYRNNCFRPFCNGFFQSIVIHLKTVFCHIYKHELRSDMADWACRCRICIGRSDNLISFAYF